MDETSAARLLERCAYCVIGTASLDGVPWVSPVFFDYDSELHIYFESERGARHSQRIAANPRIAIVVTELGASPEIEGVYIEAEAQEVGADRLETALEVFQAGRHERTRAQRTAADYSLGKPLRLYEAIPRTVYALEHVTADGYEVERRVALDLPSLISRL
jgi:nitroimidazol reductase NimA-like FMN-containing flavoprotein (pyridoxamine 5'-phosphate oxidase superfamily)